MENKCKNCVHRSEEERYTYHVCIGCSHNPFAISDRYKAKIPEIRPKEAGELWFNKENNMYAHTDKDSNGKLMIIGYLGYEAYGYMLHGKEWQRIHPLVEDERVEIEGLKLLPHYLETALRIMDENGTSVNNSRKALPNELWEEVRKFIFTSLEISEKNR